MTCKRIFLQDEFLMFSLNAGLQTRNNNFPIYNSNNRNSKESSDLRMSIRKFLLSYIADYSESTEEIHYSQIVQLSESISQKYHSILYQGRFRIGISQKIINLFLKYLWTADMIKTPFHCPFDNIIKQELKASTHCTSLKDWTTLDSIDEYKEFVNAAHICAQKKGISIAEWELEHWKRRF